jgi:hypothetical protein
MGYGNDPDEETGGGKLPPGEAADLVKALAWRVSPHRKRQDRQEPYQQEEVRARWRRVDRRSWLPEPFDQSKDGLDDACVGYAVSAAMQIHFARARGGSLQRRLNPYFLYAIARDRARDRDPANPTPSVADALMAANEYGAPFEGEGPGFLSFADVREPKAIGKELIALGRRNRLRSFVNLGTWLSDWVNWLNDVGPVVVQMNTETAVFRSVDQSGTIGYTADQIKQEAPDRKTTIYCGHAAVIVGYDSKNGFHILNSYGRGWGDNGVGYLQPQLARKCFVAGYGLLTGEEWRTKLGIEDGRPRSLFDRLLGWMVRVLQQLRC